jgi:hypothetical protein
VVAILTDHERLTPPGRHDLDPSRLVRAPATVEVCELADVVDFNLVPRPAQLTGVGEQPRYHLTPPAPDRFRRGLVDLSPTVPTQWDPAKLRHERWLGWSPFHSDFEDFVCPVLRVATRLKAAIDLCPAGLDLLGQCPGQRGLHHPFQLLELVEVVRHPVILDDAPVFRLVLRHDAIDAVIDSLPEMSRFPGLHVLRAVSVNHYDRYPQANRAVDTALTPLVMLFIGVEGMDFVAQEVGPLFTRMRNECLLFTELSARLYPFGGACERRATDL